MTLTYQVFDGPATEEQLRAEFPTERDAVRYAESVWDHKSHEETLHDRTMVLSSDETGDGDVLWVNYRGYAIYIYDSEQDFGEDRGHILSWGVGSPAFFQFRADALKSARRLSGLYDIKPCTLQTALRATEEMA